MTEQEQEVIERWRKGLPSNMLNDGKAPGRSVLRNIFGFLLMDWFVRPFVKIETHTFGGDVFHMVGIMRFGETHSFILNDNAVMSLGMSIKLAKPEALFKGFVINEPTKIGVCTIPQWAVTMFLEKFITVYKPTADRFTAEMTLASKTEEGKAVNVTVH
jgi:hypothetical protein